MGFADGIQYTDGIITTGLAMKLTKRGWNNVLILACVIMIYLFNTMNTKLVDNIEGQAEAILPPQSMLLTLEYPGMSFERLGRHWRTTPGVDIEPIVIEQLITGWQALEALATTQQSEEQGFRILLWLATQEHPRRFWLQPESRLLTDIQQQRSWQLSETQLRLLVPDYLPGYSAQLVPQPEPQSTSQRTSQPTS